MKNNMNIKPRYVGTRTRIKLILMSLWPFFGVRSVAYTEQDEEGFITIKGWTYKGIWYITSIKRRTFYISPIHNESPSTENLSAQG